MMALMGVIVVFVSIVMVRLVAPCHYHYLLTTIRLDSLGTLVRASILRGRNSARGTSVRPSTCVTESYSLVLLLRSYDLHLSCFDIQILTDRADDLCFCLLTTSVLQRYFYLMYQLIFLISPPCLAVAAPARWSTRPCLARMSNCNPALSWLWLCRRSADIEWRFISLTSDVLDVCLALFSFPDVEMANIH
jgi:hypothetical protein